MEIEYEATFWPVNKDEIRKKLKSVSAVLVKKETLYKRYVFFLPKDSPIINGWARVRDEGDKVTLSIKSIDSNTIEGQKELCVEVDDFENAAKLLSLLQCEKKAFQEQKREIWRINDVEICLDEWPFLEPLIEIEADTEKKIKKVVALLGFDYAKALFCSTDTLYAKKYGITDDEVNHLPEIRFSKNPFTAFQ